MKTTQQEQFNFRLDPGAWQEKEKALKLKLKVFLEHITQNKEQHSHWLNTLAFMEYIGCRKIIKSQNSADLNLMLLQHISEEARHAYHFKKLAHQISPTDSPNFKAEYTLKGSLAEDYFQAIDHRVEEDLNHSLLYQQQPNKGRSSTPLSNALNPNEELKSANQNRIKTIKNTKGMNLKNTLNYLYTTWLIEERALMVYHIYNQILKASTRTSSTVSSSFSAMSPSEEHSRVESPPRGSQAFPFNLDFILREEDGHLKTTVNLIQKQDPDMKERAGRLFDFEQKQFALLLKEWTCKAGYGLHN